MEQPITALKNTPLWLVAPYVYGDNLSKLTDSNQIFRNDFGGNYHLCKIWSQIIECIIFASYEPYNNYLLYG